MASLIGRARRKLLLRLSQAERLMAMPVFVAGTRFLSPAVDGAMCSVSEPWMVALLQGLLKQRPGAFLDVGANIGQTLISVKGIEPGRDYIGIEPNPQCLAYCEKLVALNRIAGVKLVPIGLAAGARIAVLQLYSHNGVDQAASILADFRPDEKVASTKFVPVFPYGEVEAALGSPPLGIVKIDVEGGEGDVLASMEAALARSKPWIVIEILPCYNAGNTDRIRRQEQIEQLMRRLDYAMLRIKKGAGGALDGLQPIAAIGIHADMKQSDYVFCPASDVKALAAAVPVLAA